MSAAVLVVVAVIAWVLLRDAGKPGQGQAIMTDRTHLQAATDPHVPYSTDPPTSGPHTQAVPKFQVYTEPIAKKSQVHGLEDGGVVINYQPDLDKATVDKLAEIANLYIKTPGKENIIMSPYPGLSNPIVLTTWGRMDQLGHIGRNPYQGLRRCLRQHRPPREFGRAAPPLVDNRYQKRNRSLFRERFL